MAVLERIRSRAGLMVGFIGLALFAFVVGDALRSGSTWFGESQTVVLSINGEKVKIQDYQKRLEALEQQYAAQGQRPTDEQRMLLNNQLAQEYITDFALGKIAQDLGLKVTPDELYALIVGKDIAPSPIAQQFLSQFGIQSGDSKSINDFINQISDRSISSMPAEQQAGLKQIQAQWLQLQKAIVNNRLQQKISALIARSYKINKVDQELAIGSGERTIALVRTSAAMISDSTARATDAEIQKFYDEHKNFFRTQQPSAQVSFIYAEVQPSAADYAEAAKEKDRVYNELLSATNADIDDVVRTYDSKFVSSYLTGAELEQSGLDTEQVEFIKSASIGAVNTPQLVSNKYNLLKLLDKKLGVASLSVRMIALDSAKAQKADSLVAELEHGASFAQMASSISVDPTTKANGGLITFPNRWGQKDSLLTEAMAAQAGLDTLYKAPIGKVIKIDQGPNGAILFRTEAPTAAVEKYRIASVQVDAPFSEKTYNDRYSVLNKILTAGGKFEDMARRAEKEGLSVTRDVNVSAQSPALSQIPSSRPIVTWALKAKDGEVGDKVFRCGTDYLVIAAVDRQIPKGFAPLSQVKEQISARLEAEKRASNLVTKLASKNITSLEAYAAELNVAVDTLSNVRASEPAILGAYTMITKLGAISKPFAAGNEVMVVQPIAEQKEEPKVAQAQTRQQETDLGTQSSYRAFADLIQSLKIEDNRANFY